MLARLTLLAFIAAIVFLQIQFPHRSALQGVTLSFNEGFPSFSAPTLKMVSFGYDRVFSNLLWLRFLQHTPPKSVEENAVSWIFLDLDALSTIDPEFYPAYEHGGIFLSVITSDKLGAKKILEKGIRVFPERWRIRAYLAYHYEHELQDVEKALEQYQAAALIPGSPSHFINLTTQKAIRSQGKGESLRILVSMLENVEDPKIRARIEEKIQEIRAGKKP